MEKLYGVIYWKDGKVFSRQKSDGSLQTFSEIKDADGLAWQIEVHDGFESRTVSLEGVSE